jgi:hypothetical protein
MIVYAQFFAKLSERRVVELSFVIKYEDPGDSKPAYNRLPHKSPHVLFGDCCEWLGFHPLHEVVDPYHHKFHYFRPIGNGFMISSPHWTKGQGAVIGVSTSDGEWTRLPNL